MQCVSRKRSRYYVLGIFFTTRLLWNAPDEYFSMISCISKFCCQRLVSRNNLSCQHHSDVGEPYFVDPPPQRFPFVCLSQVIYFHNKSEHIRNFVCIKTDTFFLFLCFFPLIFLYTHHYLLLSICSSLLL